MPGGARVRMHAASCRIIPVRRHRGQALAEYAILLAFTSSAAWLRQAVDGVDVRTVAIALVIGFVVVFVLSGRR